MQPQLEEVRRLVRTVADEELLPRFTRVGHSVKDDGSLVTEADLAMQRRLTTELAAQWPDIPLLGEEMAADEQAALLAGGGPLWVLDPLDGTSNFAAGLPFFSVSLALLVEGRPRLGVVLDPVAGECFSAEAGAGAWCNDEALGGHRPAGPLARGIGLVDYKLLAPELARRLVSEPPYSSQRSFGSVALDWCWIAAGRCHVYLHGKQKIWDFAAGSLILDEAGGRAVTLDGEPVYRPSLTPRSAVAALETPLFEEWVAWLGIEPAD